MGQVVYRALIVDDEPLIREATARAMSAQAFCCETARDGHDALEKYERLQHELVVTDLRMPNVHGHSLILELLKDQDPPSIVVLTGVVNTRLVQDLLSRGVEDIVQKPIDFNVFATKMSSLIERSKFGPGQKLSSPGDHNPLVAKIEAELKLFALCIPPALDDALSAETDALCEPPENLIEFLKRLSIKQEHSSERRAAARASVLSTAIAIPVNKNFVPQGSPDTVTLTDISEGGVCLFHTRSFPTEYVALRWRSLVSPKLCLQAVLQISRCKPLGPFYEIAGPFVVHD